MSVVLNFDASKVAPATPFDPLPSGWYTAFITDSEAKETSAKTGYFLSLEWEVQLPAEFAGRKFYDRINLANPNPVAVEIGQKQLSAICHATGVIQVTDSAALHNRPVQVKVALRPAQTAEQSGDGKPHEASNEVKGYKAVSAGVPAAAPTAPPAPAPAAAPAPAPAAWA
ncbi:MAG: DUF669 domain-containing protein, partial [Pseudomonadota bacterium]|nr:DUF669 domain-containing protein [Pseudomonadota bacterium]